MKKQKNHQPNNSAPKIYLEQFSKPSEMVIQLLQEPLFYQWCQGAFWALLTDQKDLSDKIKYLLAINDFTVLDKQAEVFKTFELFLGRPFRVWYEKRALQANSMYQIPVAFIA